MSDNKSIALTMEEVCSLAKKYAIPVTDVLLIALKMCIRDRCICSITIKNILVEWIKVNL